MINFQHTHLFLIVGGFQAMESLLQVRYNILFALGMQGVKSCGQAMYEPNLFHSVEHLKPCTPFCFCREIHAHGCES